MREIFPSYYSCELSLCPAIVKTPASMRPLLSRRRSKGGSFATDDTAFAGMCCSITSVLELVFSGLMVPKACPILFVSAALYASLAPVASFSFYASMSCF